MEISQEDRKFQKELNAGATSLALLGLLCRVKRPMYGYEIAKELEAKAGGSMPMNQGALYPVLRSLEQQGLLSSHVEPSVAGPPRKYYKTTPAGEKALRRWLVTWRNTTQFVNLVLEDSDERQKQSRRSQISARTAERAR